MESGELHIKPKYKGIGGWLIIVMIGLVITPITAFLYIYNNLLSLFQPENWHALTTYGSQAYHPLFAPLLIYELILNILLIIVPLIFLVFMFRKSRLFPRMMIIYLLTAVFLELIDVFFSNNVLSNVPFSQESKGEILNDLVGGTVRVIVAAAIWVPYFLVSKRVKATFLNINIEAEAAVTIETDNAPVEIVEEETPISTKKMNPLMGKILSIIAFIIGAAIVRFLFSLIFK